MFVYVRTVSTTSHMYVFTYVKKNISYVIFFKSHKFFIRELRKVRKKFFLYNEHGVTHVRPPQPKMLTNVFFITFYRYNKNIVYKTFFQLFFSGKCFFFPFFETCFLNCIFCLCSVFSLQFR